MAAIPARRPVNLGGTAEWPDRARAAEVEMSDPKMSAASFHALYERLRGQAQWGAADRRTR